LAFINEYVKERTSIITCNEENLTGI
jgi:hypothetical protein